MFQFIHSHNLMAMPSDLCQIVCFHTGIEPPSHVQADLVGTIQKPPTGVNEETAKRPATRSTEMGKVRDSYYYQYFRKAEWLVLRLS